MRRVALRALLHERGKFAGSVLGVAVAGTLVWTQVGLYAGFQETCSAFVARTGGDVWLVARGTDAFDNGEPLSPGARARALAHPCVRRARGVVADFTILRKPGGGYVTVQVLGFDPAGGVLLPWAMERGLPADLHGPRRVAVDVVDLDKLALAGDPLGATLMLRDTPVVVAALSRRIRSFTLAPYVFAELPVARELLGVADGAATYWVLDLEDPACAPGVLGALSSEPELEALTTEAFIARTREHWVGSSGIGTVLALGALLSLIVGIVIMGQTLHAITKDHLRELATLKALGATAGELARFVAWQAAALAAIGGVLAAIGAFGVQGTLATTGLTVVLGPAELAAGAAAIAAMCAAASVASVRAVLRLEPIEVLR